MSSSTVWALKMILAVDTQKIEQNIIDKNDKVKKKIIKQFKIDHFHIYNFLMGAVLVISYDKNNYE